MDPGFRREEDMQKTLIILRHGKAEPARGSQEDHERPLAERGVRDARRMGEYLAEQGIRPDKILCSAAARTKETLDHLLSGLGIGDAGLGKRVEISDALYLATDSQLLKIIAAQPESLPSLMLIGHNPGMHELCVRLAAEGDRKDLSQLAAAFPTCALAQFTLNAWQDKRGALKRFVTPKTLPDSL